MDFHTKKEINKLKGEIIARNAAVEAEKYAFEQELKNGLKNEIKKSLNNPPKPNLLLKIKLKFLRWKQEKTEMKEYRKLINNIKKEMGDI